jgi:hypothetical protein
MLNDSRSNASIGAAAMLALEQQLLGEEPKYN